MKQDGDTARAALTLKEAIGFGANPGTISKATFSGRKVTLEFYDDEGLGTFVRA